MSALGPEDGMNIILKDIPKGDHAFLIQATRDDRSIDEDSEVRGESITPTLRPLLGKIHAGPDEFGIKVQVKTVPQTKALPPSHIKGVRRHHFPVSLLNEIEHTKIAFRASARIVEIPETIVDVEIRSFHESAIRQSENLFEIERGILIAEVVAETVQGKIQLAESRAKQSGDGFLTQENAVRHEEDAHTLRFAERDDLIDFRVKQRLAHQMETDLFGKRSDLSEDRFELLDFHNTFFAFDRRTKAALEIADVADLDMNLGETRLRHELRRRLGR